MNSENETNSYLTWNDIYFKDAFTEEDGNINMEVNNLNVKCLNSANNKFSLDSDGNLVVNSITATSSSSSNINFDSIYPVGSIYLTTVNTNPGEYFGGTWAQIKDRFLLAAGNTYSAGSTGGEANHTLTTNEMPSHTHSFTGSSHTHSFSATTSSSGAHTHTGRYHGASGISLSSAGYFFLRRIDSADGYVGTTQVANSAGAHTYTISGTTGSTTVTGTNASTGGSQAHNNMPPYLAVYMWQRTA